MPAMGSDDQQRRRLADHVKQRRLALGLSAQRASDQARVSRQTWLNLESAARRTADANHAGVERALNWQAGSVQAILDGGDPTEMVAAGQAPPGQGPTIAELIRRINDLDLPIEDKYAAISELLSVHGDNSRPAGTGESDETEPGRTRSA